MKPAGIASEQHTEPVLNLLVGWGYAERHMDPEKVGGGDLAARLLGETYRGLVQAINIPAAFRLSLCTQLHRPQ